MLKSKKAKDFEAKEELLKAKNSKKKVGVTKEKAEKIMGDFQDLLMKVASKKELTSYNTPEMLKYFKEVKDTMQYCIENELNEREAPSMDVVEKKKYVNLDLSSDKTYDFSA